uniref:Transposase (Putative), gypsy type n=1 Tax=Tanacetum cinerariifolium TaxID=118510 RepID=A0A6L2LNH1_TANCI|nr:hypothetical protein [Tanacetum cinerariifolium]
MPGSLSETARSRGKDLGFPIRRGWVDVFQQETGEKHPSMLYQAVGFPKKLEQPILLGGREERSPLDFANENPSQQSIGGNKTEDQGNEAVAPEVPPPENMTTTEVAPEAGQVERIAATGPRVIKEHRKRGNDGVDTNAPPKLLRKDHADSRPTRSTIGGKSLTAMGLGIRSTCHVPTSWDTPVDVSDSDPLSFADPQSLPTAKKQYNINLARQVAMGSQLRLRFEQEAKLLKKSVAIVARREKRIQARENEIKNLETLLEAETDMKKITEAKNAELGKELENLRALFSDLQVSNDRLSQQVSTLQAQVTGEEKLKAAFEEFKQYENNRVEKRCVEIDARLDALSIDFDEELYPHMFTAIIGHRWVIRHGLHLAVMKCDKSIELRQVFADVVSAGIAKGMNEGLKSDGVLVSVPTVAPQGLAILLTDAATQMEISKDGASLRLLRSSSLPTMHNLD